jgi:hypothetical protein
MNEHLENFLKDIREERSYQKEKWGDEFDSKNTSNDWIAYIAGYLGKAYNINHSPDDFRKNLVKVATLCAAAVEWNDKTDGKLPRTHYQ